MRFLLFLITVVLLGQVGSPSAADLERTRFISSAQSYINTNELVEQYVGISETHPRFQAFRKGFDAIYASETIVGAMYDALKENNLLDKSASAKLTSEFMKQWMAAKGRKGAQRLDTDDQMTLLAARLGYFESIPTEQCGLLLKAETVDGKQFYAFLSTKSERAVSEFMRIVVEGLTREVNRQSAAEIITEKQVEIAGELLGRNIAKTYGESKRQLVLTAIDRPKSLSDQDYCIAARILWRETLSLKGEARSWMVRGIFM